MDVTIRVTIAFSLSIYRATSTLVSHGACSQAIHSSSFLLFLFSGVIVSLRSGLMAQALVMSINIPIIIIIIILFRTGLELRSVIIMIPRLFFQSSAVPCQFETFSHHTTAGLCPLDY